MGSSSNLSFCHRLFSFSRLRRKFRNSYQIFSRPKGYEVSIINDITGMRWQVDSRLALDRHKILGIGSMVPDFISSLWDNLGSNMTAIDVGANAGYWTLPMSHYFSRVIAFEPNSTVREKLCVNLELNGLTNVEVRPELCGSKVGFKNFFEISLPDGDGLFNNGLSGIFDRGLNLEPTLKSLINLDSLKCAEVGFIKIDVEGMESQVLSGAEQLIAVYQPLIFWEASRTIDAQYSTFNVPECLELLTSSSYCHILFLENDILELTSDLGELDIQRDFDVLSVPQNQINYIRRQLNKYD